LIKKLNFPHLILAVFLCSCQDDLIGLKVTNTLHHLSFRRGIEVLRQNNFSQVCLKRRPSPDEVLTVISVL